MTGSLPQLINGVCLITTFFSCRLVWGSYMTVTVFSDVWKALNHDLADSALIDYISAKYVYNGTSVGNNTSSSNGAPAEMMSAADAEVMRFVPLFGETNQLDLRIPLWLAASYLASNVVLHGLNVFWFGRMIETIRKRFDPPFGTRGKADKKGKEKTKDGDDAKVAVTAAAGSLAAVTADDGGSTSGTDGGLGGVGKRTRRRAY